MKYTIIEDCSPYFIRFTYDGLDTFNSYVLNLYDKQVWPDNSTPHAPGFAHHKFDPTIGREILDQSVISEEIIFNQHRVSVFKSSPGTYYRAHKDGADHRVSINYTLRILDDKCVTSWYDDGDLAQYDEEKIVLKKLNNKIMARECVGFVKKNHTPLKSMVAKVNECILFNTDIFHDWDNTESLNDRLILTLRSPNPGSLYFDDVKKLLFEKNN
jgi:hypothetical protein